MGYTVSERVDDATDAELKAVFGPHTDYYVAQWRGTAPRQSNWAAFFFSGIWLLFRRMYKIGAVFFAVVLVESLLE